MNLVVPGEVRVESIPSNLYRRLDRCDRTLASPAPVKKGAQRLVNGHKVTMLGTGLIGLFYTRTLHSQRNRDRVHVVYSRSQERADAFARENGVPHTSTDLEEAIAHADTDVVVIGLPNDLHEEAVELCAKHGKAVLCTKPLARTGRRGEARSSTSPRARASSAATSRTSPTRRRR